MLQMYPPDEGSKLMGDADTEYEHVRSFLEQESQNGDDTGSQDYQRNRRPRTVVSAKLKLYKDNDLGIIKYCFMAHQN